MTTHRNRRRRRRNNKNISKYIPVIIAIVLAMLIVLITGRIVINHINNNGTVTGVDVSSFQKEIDWEGLASEDVHFAYIKATEGSSHVDRNFQVNWDGARHALDKVGAYHFLSFDSPGETQADNFIATVPKKRDALPPAVDVEFYGSYKNTGHHPSQEHLDEILQVVLKKLERRYHKKPVIYTNNFIYDTYISGKYDDYPIWISDPSIPEKLSDDRQWDFCQYTFRNKSQYVANGEKYIDMNVFHGNLSKLRRYKGD